MNRAADPIYWAPLEFRGTVLTPHFPHRVHLCLAAVIVAPTTRESLDPMALGECRYCHQPLPNGDAA